MGGKCFFLFFAWLLLEVCKCLLSSFSFFLWGTFFSVVFEVVFEVVFFFDSVCVYLASVGCF